jgi:hypothetical protein
LELKRISKRICAKNEFIKPDAKEPNLPLNPTFIDPVLRATHDIAESSESDDEEFEWYKPSPKMEEETYFCLTNMNRKALKKGE